VTKQGGTSFTFVTEGIDAAVAQARTAAGDKSVAVAGGANVAQQCLRAGLLDEIQIHLVPTLLGEGILLFEHLSADQAALAVASVIDSPSVTHLRYRVAS
jgi:dihydrofolate reductase